MKNSIRTAPYFFFAFLAILSCTKDIALKTEVEFDLIEQHDSEGYINEAVPTVVTVIPEEEVEDFTYGYSYAVLEGEGYFADVEGKKLTQNEKRQLNPLSASILYVGTEVGTHIVKVTATDNYGFTETIDIAYSLTVAPTVWTATSSVSRIELGRSASIFLTFQPTDLETEQNHESKYSITKGSGSLTRQPSGTAATLNEFESIAAGSYEFIYTPDALGGHQLCFDLRNVNNEEFTAKVLFEVLEEIVDTVAPQITLLGSDPTTITVGSSYIDAGATATDDVDGDITNVIVVDDSDVDTTSTGTYQVTYNVNDTSGNAATQVTRTVTVVPGDNAPNNITAFAIPGQTEASIIDTGAHTVTINVPFGIDLNVAPIVLTVSPNATVSPSQSTPMNFESPVEYTVTAENGSSQLWIVTVNVAPSTEKRIERFVIAGIDGTINEAVATIMLTLPPGNDATALDPSIDFIGASIAPTSGSTVNFTNPVDFTVTAEDGSTKTYTVTVVVELSSEKDITVFEIAGTNGTFSGVDNTDITVMLPSGTDEKSLSPNIVHTGESVNPASGLVFNFTNSVDYTVTAEDGSEKIYSVTVIVANDTPTATASANPTAVINQDTDFTGSLSTDDISIANYLWDFGDGTTSTLPDPVHRYTAHGDYNVTLTVTDDNGLTDTAMIMIGVPNLPPTAVVSANTTLAQPNVAINFTGSNSTDDLGISSYSWDFGDGRTANSANTSHAFGCAGNYTVSLTVTDASGLTDTETLQITISAPTSISYNPNDDYLYGPPGTTITATLSITTPGGSNLSVGGQSIVVCNSSSVPPCPYPEYDTVSVVIPSCGRIRIIGFYSGGGDPGDFSTVTLTGAGSFQMRRDYGLPR